MKRAAIVFLSFVVLGACSEAPAPVPVGDTDLQDVVDQDGPLFVFDVVEDGESSFDSNSLFDGGDVPGDCPVYVAALARTFFSFSTAVVPGACPELMVREQRCKEDADCPLADGSDLGGVCVFGNCTYCWSDEQCDEGTLCRAGRCVEQTASCGEAPSCSEEQGCHLITPSEAPCPVCVCDSIYSVPCSVDGDCQVLSFHPFSGCTYGRCVDCKNDRDCDYGHCLPPGICFAMEPDPSLLWGSWLIGWPGGLDHFSHFRFEADGTLRKAAYEQGESTFVDDIAGSACRQDIYVSEAMLGTWEPEVTQSGFLVVRLNLNDSCNVADGWRARFMVDIPADPQQASFQSIDSDMSYMARRIPDGQCDDAFTWCNNPSWLWEQRN